MAKTDLNLDGAWQKYSNETGSKVSTKSYVVWAGIHTRCLVGGAYQRRRPTYKGCHVSSEFKSFQNFTNWHIKQVGYSESNYQLDKDLLVPGNKLYSAETCVLVPKALNSLFTGIDSGRFGLPPGVHFDSLKDAYIAQISSNGTQRYLGTFHLVEDASVEYNRQKRREIGNWIARLEGGEFAVDHKVITALKLRLKENYVTS